MSLAKKQTLIIFSLIVVILVALILLVCRKQLQELIRHGKVSSEKIEMVEEALPERGKREVTEGPVDGQIYVDEKNKFSFWYPTGWKIKKEEKEVRVVSDKVEVVSDKVIDKCVEGYCEKYNPGLVLYIFNSFVALKKATWLFPYKTCILEAKNLEELLSYCEKGEKMTEFPYGTTPGFYEQKIFFIGNKQVVLYGLPALVDEYHLHLKHPNKDLYIIFYFDYFDYQRGGEEIFDKIMTSLRFH